MRRITLSEVSLTSDLAAKQYALGGTFDACL
jgi:hypothetical protein